MMEPQQVKALSSKEYETRKKATLEVEKQISALLNISGHADFTRAKALIRQLVDLVASNSQYARSGGIMGLAGAAIAMGQRHLVMFLDDMAPPILASFHDADHRVRYFACESMYNVAKVAKGEILVYFNELFDAMTKLAGDADAAVKNGGELLDRLIKDIVIEQASTYVSVRPTSPDGSEAGFSERMSAIQLRPDATREEAATAAFDGPKRVGVRKPDRETRRTFSLERFIPLLAERIYVLHPFVRIFLVSWISILDSIPELEIISYLPEYLDGLMKYVADATDDVRTVTVNLLAELLKEVKEAAEVARAREDAKAARREKREEERRLREEKAAEMNGEGTEPGDLSISAASDADVTSVPASARPASRRQSMDPQHGTAISPNRAKEPDVASVPETSETSESKADDRGGSLDVANGDRAAEESDYDEEAEGDGSGHWVPGQGVFIDHAAIIRTLLNLLNSSHPNNRDKGIDPETQAMCLSWINEFMHFSRDTVISFTPALIPVVLSSIAHHVPAIRTAALQANYNLFKVIQSLPSPASPQVKQQPGSANVSPQALQAVGLPAQSHGHGKRESISSVLRSQNGPRGEGVGPVPFPSSATAQRSHAQDHPNSLEGVMSQMQLDEGMSPALQDPFDYQATVNELTLQFLHESEETRVAALQWLSMLHQKAPKKILSMHDGTFPALLKTLSDPSEDVIKADLQLLAQISLSSEDDYFPLFMGNLLSLFSTDRKLLETRGSLIIRQLCSSLNAERIYRTFADLLEKDEDLDFASIMVQNLHLIMITSPELSDFRKRLRNLETRDGQILFSTMYRSWSHNAVAAFSLCLLAQAYEHAANLLQIFADLEVTVSLLIQIDKLVQLLESPVFTSLRLQLLEPERNPYLFKCLYGLLMFLPQSSAFLTLRNRLNAVSPLGFLHVAPRSSSSSATSSSAAGASVAQRSTIRRGEDIKWQELLIHFRQIQLKHERSRRAQHANDDRDGLPSSGNLTANGPLRAGLTSGGGQSRRKAGAESVASVTSSRVAGTKTGRTPVAGSASRPLSPQSQTQGGSRISSSTQSRRPAAPSVKPKV